MGLASFLNPVKSNLTAILGGALVLSGAANVGLGLLARHYAYASHDCKTSVKETVKAAVQKKLVIETRDTKIVQKANIDIPASTASAIDRVRSYGRQQHMRPVATPTNRPVVGGTDPKLYDTPGGYITIPESDGIICAINTVKAAAWQQFYRSLQEVRTEENGTNTTKRSLLGFSGGVRPGVVQGLDGGMDLGAGSDERIRSRRLTVQGQPQYGRRSAGGISVASTGEVPPGSGGGIPEWTH